MDFLCKSGSRISQRYPLMRRLNRLTNSAQCQAKSCRDWVTAAIVLAAKHQIFPEAIAGSSHLIEREYAFRGEQLCTILRVQATAPDRCDWCKADLPVADAAFLIPSDQSIHLFLLLNLRNIAAPFLPMTIRPRKSERKVLE